MKKQQKYTAAFDTYGAVLAVWPGTRERRIADTAHTCIFTCRLLDTAKVLAKEYAAEHIKTGLWPSFMAGARLADVVSVYSGRVGTCMCGCAGKYSYASAHRALGGKRRGYAVTDAEVSDRTVARIFNKLSRLNAVSYMRSFVDGAQIASVDVGNRTYVVYFK